MERQAKDGTFYQQVGKDEWTPVTRAAKDGTVYKKVGSDEWTPLEAEAQAPQTDDANDYGIAATRGILMGARPFVAGVGGGIGSAIGRAERDDGSGILERIKQLPASFGQGFTEARRGAQDEEAELQARRPGLVMTGDIGGAVLSAPLFALKGAQAATAAAKAAQGGKLAKLAAGLSRGTGESARIGGIMGGAQALGHAESAEEAAKMIGGGALTGAVAQGALNVAIPAVKGAARLAPWIGKRIMSAGLGPKVEHIERYLQRADDIKGAKSVEEIKNSVDETMQAFFDDVEKGIYARDEAKDTLRLIEDKVRESTSQARLQHQIKQADMRELMSSSKQRLEQAFQAEQSKLGAVRSPIQLADDVQTAIQDLKAQVSKGSAEAYEILGKTKGTVNLQAPFGSLNDVKKQLSIEGKGAITKEAQGVLSELTELQSRVGLLPAQMKLPEAKKLIQQLDSTISFGNRAGVFTDEMNQALTGLRRGIDEQLKTIPAYKAKMEEVAMNTRLLKQASDLYGTPQSAVSRLDKISGRTKGIERDTLGALGSQTGRDFLSPVDEFVSAQSKLQSLKDPLNKQAFMKGLPEYRDARINEIGYRQGQRPGAQQRYVEGHVSGQGLLAERAQAEQGLAGAIQNLRDAEARLKPFKQLGPVNTQNAVQGLMKGPARESIELRRTMDELSKMSGKDFANWIADRRAADAFQGEFRLGSRNVNLWGALGFFGGGGVQGAAMFAPVGALVDRFGPQMAQRILDGVLKVRGIPTIQTIQGMNLPPAAKDYLSKALVQAQARSSSLQNTGESGPINRRFRFLEESKKKIPKE